MQMLLTFIWRNIEEIIALGSLRQYSVTLRNAFVFGY